MNKSTERTRSPYQYRVRDYRTVAGRRVVAEFVDSLPITHRQALGSAIRQIRRGGLAAGQKVVGDVYEVRAQVRDAHYRLLFAQVTKFIFLILVVFDKNDRKTPTNVRDLAVRRLRDWKARGQ